MEDRLDDILGSEEEQTRELNRLLAQMERERVVDWLRDRKDDRLYQATERMQKNFFHLWKVLEELYLSPHSDPSKLHAWRQAPEGSEEWRKAKQHDQAIEVLIAAVSE
jgi:hypothetical protein